LKRSVAVLGPTPQFVRWAIEQPCVLRDFDPDNLPDQSFRQLRNLREYSIGLIEDRVFEDICIHPLSSSTNVEECRGFFGDEVLTPHGGEDAVKAQCGSCPANALSVSRPESWAGCYGWLPVLVGFGRGSSSVSESNPAPGGSVEPRQIDIVEQFENATAAAELLAEFRQAFDETTPRWYGVWQSTTLALNQIKVLWKVFDAIVNQILSEAITPDEIDDAADLIQFRDALRCCLDSELTIQVELIPPGHSDGRKWTIFAHCPDCKMKLTEQANQQRCDSCGRYGNPHGQRKSKVLGLRPYVRLAGVMGNDKTIDFMKRFESRES